SLTEAERKFTSNYRRIVAYQEELDWLCYEAYGLATISRSSSESLEMGIHPQDRPVEIRLRKVIEAGTPSIFYDVHLARGATLPGTMHDEMRSVTSERNAVIESLEAIKLIETPNYKRRWQVAPWEKLLQQS